MSGPARDIHQRAQLAARALREQGGAELSESAREVIGYYRSCLHGAERAAADLIRFAAALGIAIEEDAR